MSRSGIPAAVAILFILVLFVRPGASFSSESLVAQVYTDGTVAVSQSVQVGPGTAQVEIPLLSSVLSNIVATDGGGAPLSFGISGENVTVYTLGATSVLIRYDTQNLTGKVGQVWTFAFRSQFNLTVVLPAGSTLTNVSGTPYSFDVREGSPTLALGPGIWKVEYGVPVSEGGQSGNTGNAGTSVLGLDPGTAELVGGTGAVALAGAVVLWLAKRRRVGGDMSSLREDDAQVLDFILEKGGKVLEPEIRTRFALPKTSAWRQIKRFERLGWVRVTKIGSQNQVELLKKKEEKG